MNRSNKMNLLEQKDFLIQFCSRLDNQSLELLSHTSLWFIIRLFAQDQHFWYLRVQHLLGRELKSRIGDWKTAYYSLLYTIGRTIKFNRESLSNTLSVNILLELGCDPSYNDNEAIVIASGEGYTEVIVLLLTDRRVVKLLLRDGADPSSDNNYAIRSSSQNGYTEVVRQLLEDIRVDPTAGDNAAIKEASQNGHTEVVRLLLRDGRADPSAQDNYSIESAYLNGHTEVIKLLEQDPRISLPLRIR